MKHPIPLLLCVTTALFAAPPHIGDIEKQLIVPKIVQEKEGVNNEIPDLSPTPSKAAPTAQPSRETTVFIARIVFEGNAHISTQELETLVQDSLGKAYTFEGLKSIALTVTAHYRSKGYFVARAYVPQNAIAEDTLTLAVIEGNYGVFTLSNTSPVNDANIQGLLDAAKEANIISVNTLERAMLLINDTPGAKVTRADIMPGALVGTSDFLIKTEATAPYTAYAIGDNYGSRYTGRYRLNLGFNALSPFGYGDKLSLNGVLSSTSDLKNGKVAYNFPLAHNGLRGELSASHTTYSLAKEYKALDALGHATTLEAKLSYPLIRSRQETLNLSMGFAHKKMEDEVQSADVKTPKESNTLTLGGDYTRTGLFLGLNANTTVSLALTHGRLSIDETIAKAQDAAGAKTEGSYSKLAGSIEQSVYFNPTYSLTTSLRFQHALGGKNLDGSEDFSLGGAYGVRAFPDGEHSAENGYILGAEFFYILPSVQGINHRASLFADTGYAKMQNELSNNSTSRHLSDIGVGYQAAYKEFFTRVQVARVIGGEKVQSEPERNTRVLVQVGWIY
jgi:hemolysin activation/secretion protein